MKNGVWVYGKGMAHFIRPGSGSWRGFVTACGHRGWGTVRADESTPRCADCAVHGALDEIEEKVREHQAERAAFWKGREAPTKLMLMVAPGYLVALDAIEAARPKG